MMKADLSPTTWKEDYHKYMATQLLNRTEALVAEGKNDAVPVAHNALATKAGLEAL